MTKPQPSIWVGRVVHYVAYGTPGGEFPAGVCRAAVVTEVGGLAPEGEAHAGAQRVGLVVLNPSGMFYNGGISQDERGAGERSPGTWHWAPECADKG